MTNHTRRLDNLRLTATPCLMTTENLQSALDQAAGRLLAELHTLHPQQRAHQPEVRALMEATTVYTLRLLQHQATDVFLALAPDGQDLLLVLQGGQQAHALSVHDLTRSLLYTHPGGQRLHPAVEEHLLNCDDGVTTLQRLHLGHWGDLLAQTVQQAVQTFALLLDGLPLQQAQRLTLQDAADRAGHAQTARCPAGTVLHLPPAARHSA